MRTTPKLSCPSLLRSSERLEHEGFNMHQSPLYSRYFLDQRARIWHTGNSQAAVLALNVTRQVRSHAYIQNEHSHESNYLPAQPR